MRVLPLFLASAVMLLFCHVAVGPVMAAAPAYSGDDAPADSPDADPLAGDTPESARFSYAPGMEKELKNIITATDTLGRDLEASKDQLQSLHTADELANLLLLNPDWKLSLDKYRIADDGSVRLQWEQPGEEISRKLTERGIAGSRLQWKGIGIAPQQER